MLKEEILNNAGIRLFEDEFNQCPEYITEGLVFFKTSVKLTKIINKMEKRARAGKDVAGAVKVISQMKDIRDKFVEIEKKYANKTVNKMQVKSDYKQLAAKYASLLKVLGDTTTMKVVKGLGLAAVIAASLIGVSSFISDLGIAQNIAADGLMDSKATDIHTSFAQGFIPSRTGANLDKDGVNPKYWADQMRAKKGAWNDLTKLWSLNPDAAKQVDLADAQMGQFNARAGLAGAALTTGAGALLIKTTGKAYKESKMFTNTKNILKLLADEEKIKKTKTA